MGGHRIYAKLFKDIMQKKLKKYFSAQKFIDIVCNFFKINL